MEEAASKKGRTCGNVDDFGPTFNGGATVLERDAAGTPESGPPRPQHMRVLYRRGRRAHETTDLHQHDSSRSRYSALRAQSCQWSWPSNGRPYTKLPTWCG